MKNKSILRWNIISKVSFKKIRSLPHFQCGYAGYLSYESGLINEKIRNNKKNEKIVPNIYLGLFDIVFAFDNKFKKAFLISCNLNNEIKNIVNHEVRIQKAKIQAWSIRCRWASTPGQRHWHNQNAS